MISVVRKEPKKYPYTSEEVWDEFQRWCSNDLGRRVVDREMELFERQLGDLFGFYLVQLGQLGPSDRDILPTRIRRQVLVERTASAGSTRSSLRADTAQIPIASDSVDAVLAPHVLEFAEDPRRVLREIERILIPEGRLLMSGFNPWGWWILRKLGPGRHLPPWSGRFIGLSRLSDWLELLGFDIEYRTWAAELPPCGNRALLRRLSILQAWSGGRWPPVAGVYVIRAVKRVARLTPLKMPWAGKARIRNAGAIEPTARAHEAGDR